MIYKLYTKFLHMILPKSKEKMMENVFGGYQV